MCLLAMILIQVKSFWRVRQLLEIWGGLWDSAEPKTKNKGQTIKISRKAVQAAAVEIASG